MAERGFFMKKVARLVAMVMIATMVFSTTAIASTNHPAEEGWELVDAWWESSDGSEKFSANYLDWIQIGGNWYFHEGNNIITSSWVKWQNQWYYLNENGIMVTGWKQIQDEWYYFNLDGTMVTGWKQAPEGWYHFMPDGKLATNCWIGNFHVNSSGLYDYSK